MLSFRGFPQLRGGSNPGKVVERLSAAPSEANTLWKGSTQNSFPPTDPSVRGGWTTLTNYYDFHSEKGTLQLCCPFFWDGSPKSQRVCTFWMLQRVRRGKTVESLWFHFYHCHWWIFRHFGLPTPIGTHCESLPSQPSPHCHGWVLPLRLCRCSSNRSTSFGRVVFHRSISNWGTTTALVCWPNCTMAESPFSVETLCRESFVSVIIIIDNY